MAGYSNKQFNSDVKYVQHALQPIESRITVPDSLQADALRAQLEGIEPVGLKKKPEPKPESERVFRWPGNLFNLQSGLTYATAFALMLALFYGLGLNKPKMITGDIPVEQSTGTAELAKAHMAEPEALDEALPEDSQVRMFAAAQTETADSTAQDNEMPGVGGAGKSIPLGEEGGLHYVYRANDVTDPDKEGFPLTVDIVDNATSQLLGQIDLADINTIYSFFSRDEVVTLVGEGPAGVITRTYSVADPAQAQEVVSVSQQGSFAGARQYQELVHTVTRLSEKPAGEIVDLPGSVSNSYVVISAVQTAQAQTAQKVFSGSDTGDVLLYNRNAYISYTGETAQDGGQTGVLVAQVRLEGLQIELGSVSQDVPQAE